MTNLEKSILSTIVYYDAFNLPLTSWEVFEYLLLPQKLRRNCAETARKLDNINLPDIIEAFNNGDLRNFIDQKNGFYFLKGRDELYKDRIERHKIAEQKWKKILKIVRWFQIIPFARMVCASGSLSLNHTEENSDLDVFVASAAERIWTTRFLLALLTSLFGVKRFNNAKDIRDKICFNHFVTEESLFMGFHNISTANAYYARLELIWESGKNLKSFYKNNKWIKEYLPNFNGENKISQRTIKNSRLAVFGKISEGILGGKAGDFLERFLKKYQAKRIHKGIGDVGAGRIIFNDAQLEFHPHSPEKRVIDKYNSVMKKLGFAELVVEESDI